MGRYIVKIKDRYFEWSSIVDAPITNGMTLDELTAYIRSEYGKQGLAELPERLERVERRGTSAYGETLKTVARYNRAGENGKRLTLDKIYQQYTTPTPPEAE